MSKLLVILASSFFNVLGWLFWLGSLTSALWGLAFVTMMSFGLQVHSWFWVFAGPFVVIVLAGCSAILGALLQQISKALRLAS